MTTVATQTGIGQRLYAEGHQHEHTKGKPT